MQQELQQALKQNLKDIHLPAEVGFWPLAPGWWVLFAFILIVLMVTAHKFGQHRRRNQYRNAALTLLAQSYSEWQVQNNSRQYLQTANGLLRRCVLHASNNTQPRSGNNTHQSALGKTGNAWIGILNAYSKHKFTEQTERALTVASYQKAPDVDIEQIHKELMVWIHTHKPHKDKAAIDPTLKDTARTFKPLDVPQDSFESPVRRHDV